MSLAARSAVEYVTSIAKEGAMKARTTDNLRVRTVRVELLRQGPSHNQLLSPLTPYLGICGNSPAGVVHVPYEHSAFERRLGELRYTGASESRLASLRDTGMDMARMLAGIPGLAGAIGADSDSQATLIHLRVTMSASELALLPLELSKVPITTAGESEAWLALQTKPPVCITRHLRTLSLDDVKWPDKPRILFISGPTDDVPFTEHRSALEQAIKPFQYPGTDDPVKRTDARYTDYGELLTIIENASLDDVVAAFRETNYTHVHVLAHGDVDPTSKGQPFGIRLRGRSEGVDIVSGERFSTALAHVYEGGVHQPFAVTLASCDSGLVSDVTEPAPGASFAHSLHQSGVRLVIGSQFPLTKEGSIAVVELFYRGLLRGESPHVLAHQTRSALHARYGADSHDWASLVVYEALPTNIDSQLENVRYRQGKRRLEAALQRVDLVVMGDRLGGDTVEHFNALEKDVLEAVDALPYGGAFAVECRGLRASSMKRLAQAAFVYGTRSGKTAVHFARCCDRLEEAFATYKAAADMFLLNDAQAVQRLATFHWVMVQQVAMQAVLRQPFSDDSHAVAKHAATLYLDHPDLEERAWARASLAELALLRMTSDAIDRTVEWKKEVLQEVERLVAMFPTEQRFLLSSTEKQFRRYADWWGHESFNKFVDTRRSRTGETRPWSDPAAIVQTALEAAALLQPNIVEPEPVPRPAAVVPAVAAASTAPVAGVSAVADALTGAAGSALSATPVMAPPGAGPSPTDDTLGSRPRARSTGQTFMDVRMLPAEWGDCLWLEYGTDVRRPSRVLIDCGPRGTAAQLLKQIAALPTSDREVELFILSHIDDDHIGGAIPFMEADRGGLRMNDVWFNGYGHLRKMLGPSKGMLGAEQGERFSALILKSKLPWNKWQNGGAIVLPDQGALPEQTLPGGLKITLLSPTRAGLTTLATSWAKELKAKGIAPGAGLDPETFLGGGGAKPTDQETTDSVDLDQLAAEPFTSDDAPNNGSSIAVLVEFDGKSLLLAADAHPPVVEASIRRLLAARGGNRLAVDALKVAHHGSHGNTSPELLDLLDCPRYLISTNGKKFSHPHRVTIGRIIKHAGSGCELLFNYRGKVNEVWAREDLQTRYHYRATYPNTGEGLLVRL